RPFGGAPHMPRRPGDRRSAACHGVPTLRRRVQGDLGRVVSVSFHSLYTALTCLVQPLGSFARLTTRSVRSYQQSGGTLCASMLCCSASPSPPLTAPPLSSRCRPWTPAAKPEATRQPSSRRAPLRLRCGTAGCS